MKKINIKGTIIPSDIQWIYDLFGVETTSPNKINKSLEDANGDSLEVIINSPGGDVFAGSEIYTNLKDYQGEVTVKIVGVAASAASIVAMAGDKTLISPTAQMMIHNASSVARGDYRDMQHGSDFLRNWDKSLTNAYMLKSGLSQEELLDLMDQETWFNAQQAKEKGLVDEIMFDDQEPKLVASIEDAQLIPQQVIDTIRNKINKNNPNLEDLKDLIPEGLFNQTKKKKEDNKPMNLEELKAQHPELYSQIKQEGYEEGVNAENARIKAIEDLGIPGSEDLVNKAKFETKATAEQLAVDIIKAQKNLGHQYLDNRNNDAKELDDVKGSEGPVDKTDEQERETTATAMANFINKNRGGAK